MGEGLSIGREIGWGRIEAVVDEQSKAVEPDSTTKREVPSPLTRIELPTGAGLGWVFGRGWKGRRQRIVLSSAEGACYHIMSRTAGGERLFGDTEKEALRRLMWRMARFAGLEIRTYAVMENHFHILARVPSQDQFVARFSGEGGEERLLEHLRLLYSQRYLAALRAELADLRRRDMAKEADELVAGYLRRFCNLPLFVKELKERFSRWYNEHRGRRGTLWMERFKSVLVEDGEALRTMAAYIDLNPVRAGIVKDPKDYRWSGYGEAMGGGTAARQGLCQVVGHGDRGEAAWEVPAVAKGMSAAEVYRCWLLEDGASGEESTTADTRKKTARKAGIPKAMAQLGKKRRGKLSRAELLRCRVRYFSDGLVIGTKGYVEGVFAKCRSHFGPGRKSGARALREDANGSLFTARQLAVRAVE
jgi:REP element-mobilizing transposase RayT